MTVFSDPTDDDGRMSASELRQIAQSLAMTSSLGRREAVRLIDELQRIAHERETGFPSA